MIEMLVRDDGREQGEVFPGKKIQNGCRVAAHVDGQGVFAVIQYITVGLNGAEREACDTHEGTPRLRTESPAPRRAQAGRRKKRPQGEIPLQAVQSCH